jgi:hypothetical protein
LLAAPAAPPRAEGAAQLGGLVDSAEGEVAMLLSSFLFEAPPAAPRAP